MNDQQSKLQNQQPQCVAKASCMPDKTAHMIFWPIVILGIVADLWTKSAVFQWLSTKPYEEHTVIEGIFTFVIRLNPGAAFSIASGQRFLLVSVSVVAFLIVMAIFLFGSIKQRLMQVGLALFVAGIIGNLYDRAFNDGLVRDFIDIVYYPGKHWPAFNIADSMLCIAVGLLLISSFTAPKETQKK